MGQFFKMHRESDQAGYRVAKVHRSCRPAVRVTRTAENRSTDDDSARHWRTRHRRLQLPDSARCPTAGSPATFGRSTPGPQRLGEVGRVEYATSRSCTDANRCDASRSPSPVARSSVDESIPLATATATRPKGSGPGCAGTALACGEASPRAGSEGPGSRAQGLGGHDSNQSGREAASRVSPAPAREHIRAGRAAACTILVDFCRPSTRRR
jgi:hypothetical protein